ncbi:MAG TPA: DUF2066 domain-containing protein [Thiopseudomonas sp.]|nr:DUF2066 domain-containing protein [Thiopseudomonas sp.]
MRFFIGMVAIWMSLAAVISHAEPVSSLYQVREELTSQESEERDMGLQQAFVALMQRLTGQADAAQAPALADYQADPQALISHYDYEGNTLVVNFDQQVVQAALAQTNLPVWGSNRSLVLAWWLIEDLNGLRLISDGQSNAQKLYAAAHYAGIPVRFPLGDLNDQLLIGSDPLRNNEKLRHSDERYTADAVLLVQQSADKEDFAANWQLWLGDELQQGEASADSQDALARNVFFQVNQYLAERFAIKAGEGETLNVRVQGLNLERFVLIERLLEPFTAQLQEVNQDAAQWQVRSRVEQVRAQMALGQLHETAEQDADDPSGLHSSDSSAQTLYFSW